MHNKTSVELLIITVMIVSVSACLKSIDRGLTSETVQGEMVPQNPGGWVYYGPIDGQAAYDFFGGYDEDIKRSGSRSAVFLGTDVSSDDQVRLVQRFLADRYRGKRVRFSGYIKTNQVSEWAGLWMRIDTLEKQGWAFDDMEDQYIAGTSDWTHGEVVLDVPEDAATIYLGAHLFGRGQVWVDDCAFEIVGDDVKTTDGTRLRGGRNRTYSIPNFLEDEPVNLDFEEEFLE
jgi:hypothetical protein